MILDCIVDKQYGCLYVLFKKLCFSDGNGKITKEVA